MTSLLGAAYESSDDEAPASKPALPSSTQVVAAPDVSTEVRPSVNSIVTFQRTDFPQDPMQMQLALPTPTSTTLTYNAPHAVLNRAMAGPSNPFKPASSLKRKNVLTGFAEETAFSDATFAAQQKTWESLGYSQDPNGEGIVGDALAAQRWGGRDVVTLRPGREVGKRKRQKKGDVGIVDGAGAYKGPWARYQNESSGSEEEAGLASDEEYEETAVAPVSNPIIDKAGAEYLDVNTSGQEQTTFHGSQQYDYQGRTYMHVPQDLDIDLKKDVGSIKNFIPKKLVHTWRSHTKPITSLKFFPSSGHLLLSGSADAKVKIWDVYHEKELLRTYNGHTKAITDTDFTPDGKTFLSTSYDRQMKLWDTETGTCISRFSTGKIPHVVRFNPSQPHEFLTGQSDKKIYQFDVRSGKVIQEYDYHLGPVNTITFCDENRRFITTSDDKSLRAWEYGLNVPIKYIAEPYMYPMTRSSAHPSGKFAAFQSSDNQIVVYASSEKFRQNRKKAFRGHNNAGYAIDVAISPDGQFVMSGDSAGFVCWWDWKTCKMWHKLQAGEGAVTNVVWHPQESSKVATGGLEGVIKYWD